MTGRSTRLLLVVLLLSSLGTSGLAVLPGTAASHNEDHPDPLEGDPREWEEQVASDARGDTLIRWRGSIDLYYATAGELFSWSFGESFIFIRIGYNITDDPADETVPMQSEDGLPLLPDLPEQVPEEPLVLINVSANLSDERTIRFTLFTTDYGRSWGSDQGRMIVDNGEVDGHREVLYIAPLRRFELGEGDTLSAWNFTSYREARKVDTMQGYDPANDYLPRYAPLKPFVEDPTGPLQNLPVPVPLPGTPAPPVPLPPLPVATPEPADQVPEDPYPYPHDDPLPVGVPYGAPAPDEMPEPEGGHGDDLVPIDPGRIAEDPTSGNAWNVTHVVTAGQSRLVARVEKSIIGVSLGDVGFVNFTVESRFQETDQRVAMFVVGPTDARWLLRYGLDMPSGVKELAGGGRVNMSAIVAPASLFARPQVTYTFLFLSNWGGFDFVTVTLVSTTEMQVPSADDGLPELPETLIVDMVNPDDPFRVNEPRKLMFQTLRGDNNKFQPDMKAVRADIYPVGGARQPQPYQLSQKAFSPGVYEIDFVFNKPGDWIVLVWFFDYPANPSGSFPSVQFLVTVDYEGKSPPLMPFPLALGSVGLVVGAVMLRERLTKSR